MPKLDTNIHLNMLKNFSKKKLLKRIYNAVTKEIKRNNIYGLEWGDPETVEPLKYVKENFVNPYLNKTHTALEIGPGGGRWTQYLLQFERLYLVDYHKELLDELRQNFNQENFVWIKNNGFDFPQIQTDSIDYLFSFGVFVHLDIDIIENYLKNIFLILKPNGNVILQYSDKHKIMAQKNNGFSENTPEIMRKLILDNGFTILEEDTTSLWHSSIIRFTKL